MQIIDIFITRPFGLILMFLYDIIGSYGLSIIAFTFITRLLMLPLTMKSKKSMLAMSSLQPKIQNIQKKYKSNPEKMNAEMQKLYQEENINPMGGCLPTLITLPIMMGLYGVIQKPLTFMMGLNTSQIQTVADKLGYTIQATDARAEIGLAHEVFANFDKLASLPDHIMNNIVQIDFNFLGIDLASTPNFQDINILWIIPVLSGLTALLSSIVMQKIQEKNNPGAAQNSQMKMMTYMMPLMSVYFGFILPTSLGLYWITGNVIIILQEIFLDYYFKKTAKKSDGDQNNKKKKNKKEESL